MFGRIHRTQSGHSARACLPHWCCRTVLTDCVMLHNLCKNGVIFQPRVWEKFRATPSRNWCNL